MMPVMWYSGKSLTFFRYKTAQCLGMVQKIKGSLGGERGDRISHYLDQAMLEKPYLFLIKYISVHKIEICFMFIRP